MFVCAIANQKGGVGKTTTAQNLGVALAERHHKRVLLIDLDAQGNLTDACGVEVGGGPTTLQFLEGSTSAKEATRPLCERLDIIPADIELATAELTFVQKMGREMFLKRRLQAVKELYDYVLIDCPPNLGLLTINAFAAAEGLFIPVQAEYHSLAGLALINQTLNLVREELNQSLQVVGLVVTFFDRRKKLNRDVQNELQHGVWADKLFLTVIRDTVALAEAPSNGNSIYAYNRKSYGSEDYYALADEFVLKTS